MGERWGIRTHDSPFYAGRLKNKINMCIYFYTAVQYIKVNTNLHEADIYSSYTFANNIFKEFDLNIENYLNIDKSFEKVKYSIKTVKKSRYRKV